MNLYMKSFIGCMFALSLSACSSGAEESVTNQDQEQEVVTESQTITQETDTEELVPGGPTYKLAVERNYPPFVEQDEFGKATGFDIDLLRAIGQEAGFNVQVVIIPWVGAFDGLQAGEYEILGSGVGINDERRKLADFSYVYLKSNVKFAFTSPDIKSVEDITDKKIAVQPGTFYVDRIIEEYGNNNEIVEYKTLFIGCQNMFMGKADLCVDDENLLTYFKSNFDDVEGMSEIKMLDANTDVKQIAFAVQKGSSDLLDEINDGLMKVKANGTYQQIYEKWFGK